MISEESEIHKVKRLQRNLEKYCNKFNFEKAYIFLKKINELSVNKQILDDTGLDLTVKLALKLKGKAKTLAQEMLKRWDEVRKSKSNICKFSSVEKNIKIIKKNINKNVSKNNEAISSLTSGYTKRQKFSESIKKKM